MTLYIFPNCLLICYKILKNGSFFEIGSLKSLFLRWFGAGSPVNHVYIYKRKILLLRQKMYNIRCVAKVIILAWEKPILFPTKLFQLLIMLKN